MPYKPPRDEIQPLYRAMLALGLGAVVIFALGLAEFIFFEPPGQVTGITAHVTGVYAYDPATKHLGDQPQTQYGPREPFAAVVDWAALPPDLVVAGRWFNSFGEVVGQAGPAPAGKLDPGPVPVAAPKGLDRNIPGTYLFVVERISRGQPVEVLARKFVRVRRT